MSDISIDEHGKLRIFTPASYIACEQLNTVTTELTNHLKSFSNSTSEQLQHIQQLSTLVDLKRSKAIALQMRTRQQQQQRAVLEKEFKELYHTRQLELERLERQLNSFNKNT